MRVFTLERTGDVGSLPNALSGMSAKRVRNALSTSLGFF